MLPANDHANEDGNDAERYAGGDQNDATIDIDDSEGNGANDQDQNDDDGNQNAATIAAVVFFWFGNRRIGGGN